MIESTEVWWVILTAFGVLLTGWALKVAMDDYNFVRDNGFNGILELRTASDRRTEFRKLVVKLALFGIGVQSLFYPSSPKVCQSSFGTEVVIILFAMVVIFDWNSIEGLITRHRTMDAYMAEKDNGAR